MYFQNGKNVRLKHFAGKFCSKGEIVESNGGIVTIKPEKAFTVFSFFEEDPIVLVSDCEEKFYVSQCSIISIDYINSTFNVLIESTDEFQNRRLADRFPTSYYGVLINSPGKETVFISNLSQGGVNVKSKLNVEINEKLEIETTFDGTYVYISGIVKWKKEQNKFFEYGLFTEESVPELSKLLQIVKRDQFLSIKNLKYENSLLLSV